MKDGSTSVDIDAGFKVAPGDASDIEVVNAHAWGSEVLVFIDGMAAFSALGIAHNSAQKGTACSFPSEILLCNLMMISGKKRGRDGLKVDSEGRVSAKWNTYDILLRKRA